MSDILGSHSPATRESAAAAASCADVPRNLKRVLISPAGPALALARLDEPTCAGYFHPIGINRSKQDAGHVLSCCKHRGGAPTKGKVLRPLPIKLYFSMEDLRDETRTKICEDPQTTSQPKTCKSVRFADRSLSHHWVGERTHRMFYLDKRLRASLSLHMHVRRSTER